MEPKKAAIKVNQFFSVCVCMCACSHMLYHEFLGYHSIIAKSLVASVERQLIYKSFVL